ncbi:50S ribosomal protein L23 [Holospora curviuscula]|uniref:Large ribosomal subunit protein uL23 n=1 Tax=Holospora curviuscula TaxID=1082868 RepID=A0A2S5R8N8_9PROT|nr:50S ribosomal protein L23 [Holospora curviuscula]PPE03657.1 50S ribosomal protein L23 [Holospora curviuscula]
MIHRFWNKDHKKKLSEPQVLSTIFFGVVTEKSFLLSQHKNQYVFRVAFWANKMQIKEALKRLFDVDALSVNTLIVKGKNRKFKGRQGVTTTYKKAIIRLSEGQALDKNLNLGGTQ